MRWLVSCLLSCDDPEDEPTCYCTGLKTPQNLFDCCRNCHVIPFFQWHEFWRTLWPLRLPLPLVCAMQTCLAVVCKLSVCKLKLNYLGHRFLLLFSCHEASSFRLFHRCQWLLSWLFCNDWWLTMCFLSLYSTNKTQTEPMKRLLRFEQKQRLRVQLSMQDSGKSRWRWSPWKGPFSRRYEEGCDPRDLGFCPPQWLARGGAG